MHLIVTSPNLSFVKDIKVPQEEQVVEIELEFKGFKGENVSKKDIRISLEKALTKKGELSPAGEVEIFVEKTNINHARIIFRFMRRKTKNYYFNFVAKVKNSNEELHFCQKIQFF